MPKLDDWTQIPTGLLDAGQRMQDAASWADSQRATLAETWANAQRQAVAASANAWQQGTQALDSFAQGLKGPASTPGYNDMAGASSSQMAPMGGVAGLDAATSPQGPTDGTPLASLGNAALGTAGNLVQSMFIQPLQEAGQGQDVLTSQFQQGMPDNPEANAAAQAAANKMLGGMMMGMEPGTQVTGPAREAIYGAGRPILENLFGGLGAPDATRAGIIASHDASTAGQVLKNATPEHLRGFFHPAEADTPEALAGAQAAYLRMYHGTGSAFERPDALKFDPNGLFGPGYYLTSSPEVASSYSTARGISDDARVVQMKIDDLQNQIAYQESLRTPLDPGAASSRQAKINGLKTQISTLYDSLPQGAPNVRAVDVPAGLRLLDADAPVPPELVAAARKDGLLSEPSANVKRILAAQGKSPTAPESLTGEQFWKKIGATATSPGNLQHDSQTVNRWLASQGYDGIQYGGGKRIPILDAAGQPIEHQAVAVFPNALGKLRNALSGTYGGLMSEDATRMYHGTNRTFSKPDPARYGAPDDVAFGPAHYNSTDPEVANNWATMEGDNGAQVRAIDVPNSLRFLDAGASVTADDAQNIISTLEKTDPAKASAFRGYLANPANNKSGFALYTNLSRAVGGKAEANRVLVAAGYDGIRDPTNFVTGGGPLNNAQVAIFPESLSKVRNVLSGQYGGLMSDAAQGGKRVVQSTEQVRPGAIGTAGINLPPPQPPILSGPAGRLGRTALVGAGQGAIGGGIAASQEPGATPGSVVMGAVKGAPLGVASTLVREGLPAGVGSRVGPLLSRVANQTEAAGSKEGFAGNIRLEKLPEGVRDVVTDVYNQAPQKFENARRGVISDAEVAQLADQVGGSVQKIIKQWQPGQAKNAETLLALRNTLAAKAQDVVTAQQAVQGSNSAENLLKLQQALMEHAAIQETVSGVTAEAGRALRQFRQTVSGAIASGNQSTMEDVLKKLGGREWTEELAQKFGQLDTSDPTQVGTFIRDIYKPHAADYLNEWFYNAILSAPPTHIANAVSNTLNAVATIPERALAGAIDEPLSRLQGRGKERFIGESPALAYGALRGIPEGVRAATYTMAHGFSPTQALGGLKGEMKGQAFKGPIGNAINVPSRLMTAADAFFYPVLQRAQQNALIYRRAKQAGLTGDALAQRVAELTVNVPADILEQSAKMADYNLYRQAPKTIGQAAIKARGMKFLGVEPLRFVIPFLQVPINATKYGLERSPLGFINAARSLASKDPAAADDLARAAIGSLVWGSVYAEVKAGNIDITGAAPTSQSAKDAFYRQGKLPFGIKIGNTWHSYQRWEPFNHALTQVAAVVDAERNAKEGMSLPDIVGQAALTEGQNVESQTFLTNLNGMMNAFADPARYGAQFVAQLETGPLPLSGAMRTAANVMDTRQRAPQGPVENIESVVPGLSQNVPPRLNNYGQEQQQGGPAYLPYKSQAANNSPMESELARLGVEPGATGKTLKGIDLTRQETADYQRLSGQTVYQSLQAVIADPRYRQADDVTKAKILQRAIGIAKDQASTTYIRQLATQQGQAAILQRIQQKKLANLPRAG